MAASIKTALDYYVQRPGLTEADREHLKRWLEHVCDPVWERTWPKWIGAMAEIEGRNGNEGFDVKARDVMVSNVITVGPDTPVREAANTLVKHQISALPVVNKDGELVGIISEGDLMRRPELDTDYRRSWWLELFSDTDKSNETIASEYVKTHGRRVRDVMTREVITAKPGTSLREIADLLERNRIKRVPIVANREIGWYC